MWPDVDAVEKRVKAAGKGQGVAGTLDRLEARHGACAAQVELVMIAQRLD